MCAKNKTQARVFYFLGLSKEDRLVPLKLFLDMVSRSSADVTRALRGLFTNNLHEMKWQEM